MNTLGQSNRTDWRSKSGLLLRIAVTLLILAYLAAKLHWAEFGAQFLLSDPLWLSIACLLMGVSFVVASVRWWLLLRVQNILVPFKVVTALTFIGQFFNSFLFGASGGDVVKLIYILRYSPNQKTHATLSILMDRALGMFVLLCCALVALPWQLRMVMQNDEAKTIGIGLLALFAVIAIGAATLLLMPFQRLPVSLHRLWHKVPKRHIGELLIRGFRQHGKSLPLTLEAIACSIAIHLLIFTAGYCIGVAIHLEATYIEVLVVLAVVTCVVSLPISIGGHGVREGAFVLLFAVFGITIDQQTRVSQEPAVLFSVLFFLLLSVWSLMGGLVYLTFQRSYRG